MSNSPFYSSYNLEYLKLVRAGLAEPPSVSGAKGDQDLKNQELQQQKFTGSIMKAFKTQFGAQSALMNFLNPKLEAMIAKPEGYSPEALSAARTNAIDTSATLYQNALKGVQAKQSTHGGPTALPSGVDAQIQGQLAGAQAGSESQALNSIEQQNQDLMQQNRWRAVSALGGSIDAFNPNAYASNANQGSSVVGSLGTAYNQTQQNSFWSKLGDSFASTLGSTLAGGKGGVKSLYA